MLSSSESGIFTFRNGESLSQISAKEGK